MRLKTFLQAHWAHLAAADFFTVEVLTLGGLVRCWVFVLRELETVRVHIAGPSWLPALRGLDETDCQAPQGRR